MKNPVFDFGIFDAALFGGEADLFDSAVFDSAIFDAGSNLLPVRAIYWSGSSLCQIKDADVGSGMRPIVLLNGQLKERSSSEGVPVVLDGGQLRCISSSVEMLLI